MDRSHIKKRGWGDTKGYFGTLKKTGREEDREIDGEDR